MQPIDKRILVTGADGNLGKFLRRHLPTAKPLRSTHRGPFEAIAPDEETVVADLADYAAVRAAVEGMDAIVHLGGQATEADWETVLASNIVGTRNLLEAAREAGVERVVFASTNHVTGLYRVEDKVDHTTMGRPDTLYGVSKSFGEQLGAYYAYKHGLKVFNMRIGSAFEKPTTQRMLAMWQSQMDFVRLCHVGLTADYQYEIVYGVSRNSRSYWDNRRAEELGYRPEDSADDYVEALRDVAPPTSIEAMLQGGKFASDGFTGDPDAIP
jgi:uronate dehydrogenase